MESVIPQAVIEHLREIARKQTSFAGAFTTKMLCEEMDISDERARDLLRQLMREGRIQRRRISISDDDAWGMGYLGATSVIAYDWVDDAAA